MIKLIKDGKEVVFKNQSEASQYMGCAISGVTEASRVGMWRGYKVVTDFNTKVCKVVGCKNASVSVDEGLCNHHYDESLYDYAKEILGRDVERVGFNKYELQDDY